MAPIFSRVVQNTLDGPTSGVWIHRKSVLSGHSGKECPTGLQNQDLHKNHFLQLPAAQSALCILTTTVFRDFPVGSVVKNPSANARDES